jgi:hypothetical protein
MINSVRYDQKCSGGKFLHLSTVFQKELDLRAAFFSVLSWRRINMMRLRNSVPPVAIDSLNPSVQKPALIAWGLTIALKELIL